MNGILLIPFKSLATAKQRLAEVLNQQQRSQLAEAMLRDVMAAAAGVTDRIHVALVTGDAHARQLAEQFGFLVIEDRHNESETAAIEMATGWSEQRGYDTESYTTGEIERVARVGFELARKRQNRICSVEKANVMQSGLFWRQTVTALHQREFADVELSHMYADNCAMQLVRNPRQFDVIVTSNIFGDILSDLASMLTGSLGMLPSATLGAVQASGKRHALYEPIHGSAPDIAGKGVANPIAQILSFAMLLRYSFGMEEEAALIESACTKVLGSGLRTADVMAAGTARVGTSVMGEAIIRELDKLA